MLAKFQSIGDIKNRDKLIDGRQYHWTKIKKEIISVTYDKCWFSEGKSDVSHFHIEHFRPKKKVEIVTSKYGYVEARTIDDNNSYWWLAFTYKNFRICGPITNSYKGNYFPLKFGSIACNHHSQDLNTEEIVLLDPTVKSDTELLTFDIAGTPIPNADILTNPYENFRADLSIKIYGLKDELISNSRKQKLSDINTLIEKINDYYNMILPDISNPIFSAIIVRECNDLISFTYPSQSFSKMAKKRIEFIPYQWAIDFVHPYL
jgi:hypothetical protein